MADARRRPSEEEAEASKEAHEQRYRSLGTGSGTWLDGVARNVGLPDSMQKHVDDSTFNRTMHGRIVGEAEQAEYRAKMKRWGYTAAAVMTVGSVSFVLGAYLRSRAPKRVASLTAKEALRQIEFRKKGVLDPSPAQLKGQEEELVALQTRWQELRTRHYERHPFLYRDD